MELNDSPGSSPVLLWERGNTLLRGKIIAYSSQKKRKDNELENHLQQIIKELKNAYATDQIQTNNTTIADIKGFPGRALYTSKDINGVLSPLKLNEN